MEFYASCPEGFESALADELKRLGLSHVRRLKGRATFEGELEEGYRACLWSRLASRVFVVLERFEAQDADELYDGVYDIAWESIVRPGATIAITADGTPNGKLLGIVASRDYRVNHTPDDAPVTTFMTPIEKLVTAPENTSLHDCNNIIWDNKINTLPLVDAEGNLKYFVFRKDYDSHKKNINELLDKNKSYVVGAGINTRDYAQRVPALVDAGVDLFIVETMMSLNECRAALIAIREVTDLPVCVTLSFNEDGRTLFGTDASTAMVVLQSLGADAVGVNCSTGPEQMAELVREMKAYANIPVIAKPNDGMPEVIDGETVYRMTPEEFAAEARLILEAGAGIVGGCCGTTPEHIRGLHDLLVNDVRPPKKLMPAVYSTDRQSGCGQEAAEEKTELIQKLERGEKIFVVELDPPFDANDTKLMDGASLLRDIGVDMITLADSPLARPRADSIASAIKMRYTRQMEAMPHISCRDKNVIAHRAQLLGMHMNGLRHALIVTGDPIARGDRESIKSVFNFNSIKLMKYVQTMNQEVFGNRPIYYGGALNHNNGSADNIAARMRLKMEAGAQWFLTQPIYGQDDIDRLRELKEKSGGRIIAGIMPLVSRKNALFIKNEMPGIHVPEHVLEQYEEGMSREAYEDVAAAISVDLMKRLEDVCDGYYMMTPFNRAALIKRIILQAKKELR